MAIANGTCVSFCNQPKEHYLATSRESRRYVVASSRFAGAGIWLRQESLSHILASPGAWVNPLDNRGKFRGKKRIQWWSNASQHVPNYLQPFTRYCNFFLPPLAFNAQLGCSHWNSWENFGPHKTRIMGLPGSKDSLTIG